MKYPPNFKGFLKAAVDTIFKHHPKKNYPGRDKPRKESYWRIKGYEIYEPDKDPGMEFWQKKAEEFAERKEQEKIEAEKQMIEDYEFMHKDDRESEQPDNEASEDDERINNESDSNDKATRKESAESEIVQEGTGNISSDQDAAKPEQDNSSAADDFHADVGIELDEEFDDDF